MQALAIGLGSGLAALVGLLVLARGRWFRPAQRTDSADTPSAAMLFKDGQVMHSDDALTPLFDRPVAPLTVWSDVAALLGDAFPDFPPEPPPLRETVRAAIDDRIIFDILPEGRFTRLVLKGPVPGVAELLRLRQASATLAQYDRIMTATPYPVWQTGAEGQITWVNAAYQDLSCKAGFPDASAGVFDLAPGPPTGTRTTRVSMTDRRRGQHWFEVKSRAVDGGWLHVAHNIDTLVEAEQAQRNFVQTLTKTFAHLPIGLAVFDRDRRLVLFNPALVDLTRLPPEFLSARPNLLSFFDHMREKRTMPEPKNYGAWRQDLAKVIAAAQDDRYSETWNLPSGLTYKITGRPHPDGAVAFLIEDISAEISLTRRFRSELELSQSVIETLDTAIVVFSQSGTMSFANAAYGILWRAEAQPGLLDTNITDATRQWQEACAPSPVWAELRDFVSVMRDRAGWEFPLEMLDGTQLLCHVDPAPGGATVIRFDMTAVPQMAEEQQRIAG